MVGVSTGAAINSSQCITLGLGANNLHTVHSFDKDHWKGRLVPFVVLHTDEVSQHVLSLTRIGVFHATLNLSHAPILEPNEGIRLS